MTPCLSPPPQAADANRSASVAAQPLCMNGARQETPRSDGIWNGCPVPTSTVKLFVSSEPAWQVAHPTVGP